MATSFYETVVLGETTPGAPTGLQVLSSPSRLLGEGWDYRAVFEGADFEVILGPAKLRRYVTALADPEHDWQRERARIVRERDRTENRTAEFDEISPRRPRPPSVARSPRPRRIPEKTPARSLTEDLFSDAVIAAELSPLSRQTLATLASSAAFTALYIFGEIPMVAFVGGQVGLVVIRGLGAVGSALWDGARPEVEEFGGDAASTVLDAIRKRLGISRR
jgi:hypothetical protein